MSSTVTARAGSGLQELLLRFRLVAHKIAEADHIGAMTSLRYWDRGYDPGVPRPVLDEIYTRALAARVCLASGDAAGAADHVRQASALAASAGAPAPAPAPVPARRARRVRQSVKSPS